MKRTNRLIQVAKAICDANPNASITGTLMLHLIGIEIDREIGDIDIMLNDWTPKFVIPEGFDFIHCESSSVTAKYSYNIDGEDIKIDVFSSSEETKELLGLRIANVDDLIRAKLTYINNGTDKEQKHAKDVELLRKHFGDDYIKKILPINFIF